MTRIVTDDKLQKLREERARLRYHGQIAQRMTLEDPRIAIARAVAQARATWIDGIVRTNPAGRALVTYARAKGFAALHAAIEKTDSPVNSLAQHLRQSFKPDDP